MDMKRDYAFVVRISLLFLFNPKEHFLSIIFFTSLVNMIILLGTFFLLYVLYIVGLLDCRNSVILEMPVMQDMH